MALIHIEENKRYRYGIWQMDEDEETLIHLSGCKAPTHIANSVRRTEYLSVRSLAKALGVDPEDIAYHSSGRPYLKNGDCNISIAHTKKYVAVLLSKSLTTGIDIETRSEKVIRIKKKFMLPEEEALIISSDIDQVTGLLLHWCAKEAMFKAIGETGVDFVNSFKITHFTPTGEKGSFKAIAIRDEKAFQVDYQIEKDFVLTCCFLI
jgi:phosphopantetheinyl transferase